MQYLFFLLPILLHVQCSDQPPGPTNDTPRHIEIARANIGVPPKDSVDSWLAFVGLPPGNPFCAAAQSVWLHQAGVKEPLLKTGLANNYVFKTPQRLHISAGRVLAGVEQVPKGALLVYRRGDTVFGHIGAATSWDGASGVYISANTSPPGGAHSSGGGVWEKEAHINPNSHLRIIKFIHIYYE